MDNLKHIRWQQRFENFEKSYKLLSRYINCKLDSEIEKAGFIQFFEITFELSWKLLKDYLESEGFTVKSPRESIKTAFQMELINEPSIMLQALTDRNLSVHTYDESAMNDIISSIKNNYFIELKNIYEIFSNKVD